MKKKLWILVCAGMMLTGCADKEANEQEESKVFLLDLNGNIQQSDTQEEDLKSEQENVPVSDTNEIVQKEENKEMQEQESTNASIESTENTQNKESTQDLYMQFINNEISLTIGNDYPQHDYRIFDLERGSSYTFAELGQYVNQSYFDPEYSQKTSYDYAQYTYVECPDSDSKNFLIKFVGLNIYTQDDDSFVVYVLTENNGKLYLTDEYECWARSYVEQYQNGLCDSSGSSGAGDHYKGISAIMSNGKMTNIYDAEILSGWWINYVNEEIYNEVFDENTEIPMNVAIYTSGEDTYYVYDISECTDEQAVICETYINRCRDEAGINWVTGEEVQEAIKQRCSLLGINYNALAQQENVEWVNIK